MTDNFSQIRQDLTTPNILSALRQDPQIRSKLTVPELKAFDAILNEVGSPDEYASLAEYVLRALPYVRMIYNSSEVIEPLQPSEQTIRTLMRNRFL
jgi:hypothetical protein